LGRQLVEPSTKGMPWGLALQNLKTPAVIEVLYGSVVAQENPHVLLLEVATSLSLRYLAVMPFAGILWGIIWESPESLSLMR
jgi:hypothetical protein